MPRALVTGASNGIGVEIARGLAAAGYRVELVGRNFAKTEAVAAAIRASTGNARVSVRLADFNSLAAVRALAEQVLADARPLDVLVNNAAVITVHREQTDDGIERMFGVNYLAHYLLTRLLLPALQAAPTPRLVQVASEAHRFCRGMHWDDMAWQQGFRVMKTYGHSKLGNLLLGQALREKAPWLLVLSAHPGAVSTGLGAQNGWFARLLHRLLRPFFRTPAQGADTPLWLATAPLAELAAHNGGYFIRRRLRPAAPWAQDAVEAERLWRFSADLCGLPETD